MEPNDFAAEFINELESIPELTTAPMRKLRRKYSKRLRDEDALYVFEVVHLILDTSKYRWIVYEFIKYHHDAFHSLDRKSLETLGYGMNSWSSVDCFSRTLSGPAWRDGLISEDTIRDWAQSPDRWWRRAALVSTVALNMRSYVAEKVMPVIRWRYVVCWLRIMMIWLLKPYPGHFENLLFMIPQR